MAGEEEAEATRERSEQTASEENKESEEVSDQEPVESNGEETVDTRVSNSADTTETEWEDTAGEESTAESPDAGDELRVLDTKAELEDAAESFVEIERHLGHAGAAGIRARAIDVERIPAEEVPDDFPYEITTGDALALTLTIEDSTEETVATYFNWPGEEADERLSQLLTLADVSADRFADLHGKPVLLQVESGHYVPLLPDELPRGDERAIYGILAGIAPSITVALFSFFGLGSVVASVTFLWLWIICTFVVLPLSVYLDSWHLRTTTDWDGGPLFWAFFSMLPVVNVLVVPAYLIMRENARPVA